MTVSGDDELDRQLMQLQTRTIRQAVRSGATGGLRVIQASIVSRAPRGKTGDLARAIGYRLVKGQPVDEILGKVGGGVGKKTGRSGNGGKSRRGAPHAHLVTLGTLDRYTQRGAFRGRMPVNAFVTAGFLAAENKAADKVLQSVGQVLEDP